LLSRNPSSLFISSGCNFISVATLTSLSMYPNVLPSTLFLIQCCVFPLWISLVDTNIDIVHVLCTFFNGLTCLLCKGFSTSALNTIDP
jgi:cytochrome bd-type quinol oxidase subunit 2